MIQFLDETSLNPLPVGVFVAVANAGTPSAILATGFINLNGMLDVALDANVNYIATFVGEQAPNVNCAFSGNADTTQTTVAIVAGYRSPALTQEGYAAFQAGKFPLKFASDDALQDGGNIYPYFLAGGSSAELLDASNQYVRSLLRLETCVGSDMDSWARDFLGDIGARYLGELDDAYRLRLFAMLFPRKVTLAAIARIVTAFYASITPMLAIQWANNLSLSGPDGGLGDRGGLGVVVDIPVIEAPTISVWDKASQPNLAAQYDIVAGQFVVQITSVDPYAGGFFLDFAHLDQETYLVDSQSVLKTSTAPDPRLGELVDFIKADGYEPVYLTSQTLNGLPLPLPPITF